MEEKQFRMDFDAFLRSFKQSKNGSFAFLLGAGASITSGVQSAEDCIWDWKKLIYVTNNPTNEAFLDIHSDCCRKKIQTMGMLFLHRKHILHQIFLLDNLFAH